MNGKRMKAIVSLVLCAAVLSCGMMAHGMDDVFLADAGAITLSVEYEAAPLYQGQAVRVNIYAWPSAPAEVGAMALYLDIDEDQLTYQADSAAWKAELFGSLQNDSAVELKAGKETGEPPYFIFEGKGKAITIPAQKTLLASAEFNVTAAPRTSVAVDFVRDPDTIMAKVPSSDYCPDTYTLLFDTPSSAYVVDDNTEAEFNMTMTPPVKSGNTINSTITVGRTDDFGKNQPAVLMVGVYDGDSAIPFLIAPVFSVKKDTYVGFKDSIDVSINIGSREGSLQLKAMLWDGANLMKPLFRPAITETLAD